MSRLKAFFAYLFVKVFFCRSAVKDLLSHSQPQVKNSESWNQICFFEKLEFGQRDMLILIAPLVFCQRMVAPTKEIISKNFDFDCFSKKQKFSLKPQAKKSVFRKLTYVNTRKTCIFGLSRFELRGRKLIIFQLKVFQK